MIELTQSNPFINVFSIVNPFHRTGTLALT